MGALSRALRFEKRTTVDKLSSDLFRQLGGLSTKAGPTVNEETSIRCSVVFACVRVIAETIASLPLKIYRITDDGKEPATNHGLYQVLYSSPNPLMTSFTWRETSMAHDLLWGNAYSEIVRDGNGRPYELWPIPPGRVRDVRLLPDMTLEYAVERLDRSTGIVPGRNMLHVPGLGFDGLVGKSVIRVAAEQIGVALATEEFTSRYFSNGAQLGVILEHPGEMGEEGAARLKADIEGHTGLGNVFRTMVLEEGMKWHEASIKLVDAQLLELRNFQVEDIARNFRVPLMKLGVNRPGVVSYNSAELQNISFVVDCLMPWLVRWEQAINQKLLLPGERSRYFVKFNVDALLRGDFATRMQGYQTGIQAGFLTRAEARELEDLNAIDGLDEPLVPANMKGIDDPEPVQAVMPPVSQGDTEPLLNSAWDRITRRVGQDMAAAARKALKNGGETAFQLSLSKLMPDHRRYIEEQLAPLVAAGISLGGHDERN